MSRGRDAAQCPAVCRTAPGQRVTHAKCRVCRGAALPGSGPSWVPLLGFPEVGRDPEGLWAPGLRIRGTGAGVSVALLWECGAGDRLCVSRGVWDGRLDAGTGVPWGDRWSLARRLQKADACGARARDAEVRCTPVSLPSLPRGRARPPLFCPLRILGGPQRSRGCSQGSVRASSRKPRGRHRFAPHSGPVPGLCARSLVGAGGERPRWAFLRLFLSFDLTSF